MKDEEMPREISKKELIEGYGYGLTVGELKKFLLNSSLPDNAPVVIERVEDSYYEKSGWAVYLKENHLSFVGADGEVDKMSMNQYTRAWGCVKYKDEDNILFIDLHY